MAKIRIATREDVSYVAKNLREADRKEVLSAQGDDADLDTLLHLASLRSAPCQAWCDADGTVLAVFGFAKPLDGRRVLVPWLLGTDRLKLRALAYVKEARRVIRDLLHDGASPYMRNYVHTDNAESKRFLQLVGFTIHDPEPYGRKGELFHMFDAGDASVYINDFGCATLLTSTETRHV